MFRTLSVGASRRWLQDGGARRTDRTGKRLYRLGGDPARLVASRLSVSSPTGYPCLVTDPTAHPPRDLRSHRASAVLAALEGLVLLGFVGFFGYEIASGATDDITRGVTSGALILVFAVFLLAMARGWARLADWPRTPTLLWNLLMLPVAWSLFQSDRSLVALGVGVVAVASVAAALGARPNDPIRRDPDDADDRGDAGDPGDSPQSRRVS